MDKVDFGSAVGINHPVVDFAYLSVLQQICDTSDYDSKSSWSYC